MREGTAGVRSSMLGPPAVYTTAGQRENHAFSRKRHPADVRPKDFPDLVEFDTSRMIENCFATKRRGCSSPPLGVGLSLHKRVSRADRTRQNGAS